MKPYCMQLQSRIGVTHIKVEGNRSLQEQNLDGNKSLEQKTGVGKR